MTAKKKKLEKGLSKTKRIAKKTTKKKKAEKALSETKRIAKVIDLLCMGLNVTEVNQFIAKKMDWKVKHQTVGRYIRAATKIILDRADFDPKYQMGQAITRLDELYKRCISIQDFKAATAVQREMNRLLGLDGIAEPDAAEATVRKKTDVEKLYDVIDSELGYLTDDINSTYVDTIQAAKEKIGSLETRILFLQGKGKQVNKKQA